MSFANYTLAELRKRYQTLTHLPYNGPYIVAEIRAIEREIAARITRQEREIGGYGWM